MVADRIPEHRQARRERRRGLAEPPRQSAGELLEREAAAGIGADDVGREDVRDRAVHGSRGEAQNGNTRPASLLQHLFVRLRRRGDEHEDERRREVERVGPDERASVAVPAELALERCDELGRACQRERPVVARGEADLLRDVPERERAERH